MAQNVDDKLGLSLDDLIEKERVKEAQQQGGGRQRGGGGGRGGHHRGPQQRAQPYPQQRQHQRGGGGGGPPNGNRRGGGRHGGGPGGGGGGGGWQGPPGGGGGAMQNQQQQWGGPVNGSGGGAGPQRRTSVFQRLGGLPVKDMYPQEQTGGAPYLAGGPARAPRQQQQGGGGAGGGWGGPPPRQLQGGGWGGPSPPPPRQQRHQQQQQQPAFAPPSRELSARIDEMGDVLVAFHGQDIVKVCANGDVYLSHAGEQSDVVLAALNEVLAYIGLKIVALGAAWSVSDGRSSQRFDDKMLVRSKGPATAGRIVAVKEAFGLEAPDAAAASAASMAAARAAGILPDADAAAQRRLRAQGRA